MMLEVLYDTVTLKKHGHCADPDQFGLLNPKAGQKVVILALKLEDVPEGSDYIVDLDAETLTPQTPPVVKPDFKAQWKVAKNQEEINIIFAKMLKLEGE